MSPIPQTTRPNVNQSTNTDNANSSINALTNVGNGGNTSTISNSGNTTTTSNAQYTSNNTVTDFGSVQAALNGMQSTASAAIGVSGNVASNALADLNNQSLSTIGLLSGLFSNASTSSANSLGTGMQALGLANNTTAQATAAVTASQQAQTKTTEMVMLGAALIVAVTLFHRG